jgi:glucose/arabinose dehydrogenase
MKLNRPAMTALASLGLAACVSGAALAQSEGHARIVAATEIAHNLSQPWGLTFLPDGSALVSSRDTGEIRRIYPVTGQHVAVGMVPDLVAQNDFGILDLAASPGFATDRTVYSYLATADDHMEECRRAAYSGRSGLAAAP